MSGKTPGFSARIAAKWVAVKPLAMALGAGLIAGPLITSFAGFQVRASTAQAAARAGVVEQQAMFCVERARAAMPGAAQLDWQKRNELAQQWAMMPGQTVVDRDVVYACSLKLSA